jgi:arabinofuranosyltransferase
VPDRGECPAARARRWRDDVLVIAAALFPLALFAARERQIAGASGFPLDDAWIHLQFARNLAEGAGFSFNPGAPVAGSTAPLWTLLLAAGAAASSPSLGMAKAFGVAATLGAAILTRRAALAWGARADVALLAAVALLWTGPVAWGALSGMEVALAAFLVAAALLAHAHDRLLASSACAALAVLARPEAFLLIPLFVLARTVTLRRAAAFALVTVVTVAPAALFSLWTVGTLYPATAAAKVEGGLVGWLGGVNEPAALTWIWRPWTFLTGWIGWLTATHWLLPLALVPGLVFAWRRAGRALGVVALALLAHPFGMALLAPYRGPAFQEGRYSIHLLPLVVLTLAVALGGPEQRGGPPSETTPATTGSHEFHSWVRTVAVVWLGIAVVSLVPAATRYGWAVQNINAMQVHLGRWVDTNLPRTARIAANDIGAIAYFSRREVIDLMGLVTPDIIPFRRRGELGVMRYLKEACPQYVIIFPAWFPQIASSTETLEPVYRVRLERNEVAGAAEMVVYRLTRCAV